MMLGHQGVVSADAAAAVRVVCRYPFDHPDAEPRWVIEHCASIERLAIAPESTLRSLYPLLLCRVPLNG